MMWHSAEARWFIPGALPDEVLRWFKGGGALDSEGVQVHEYLLFPDCESVGVKLREGRFEIKAILGASQPLRLGPGIEGRTDQWVKWSLASEGLQSIEPALHQSGRWLKVAKERFLRKFSADEGSLVEITGKPGPFPGSGCNIELTRIALEADPRFWFSFAFEAFGLLPLAAKILPEAMSLFVREHGRVPGISLSERDSLSYPSWLTKLAKKVEVERAASISSGR